MEEINWKEVLGWKEEQIEQMKFFGFSYLREGKYDIAIKIFKALEVLTPQDPYVLKNLGALLLMLKEPEKALPPLKKALEHSPSDPKVELNIAQCLLDMGNREEALDKIKNLTNVKDKTVSGKAKALLMGWGQ